MSLLITVIDGFEKTKAAVNTDDTFYIVPLEIWNFFRSGDIVARLFNLTADDNLAPN